MYNIKFITRKSNGPPSNASDDTATFRSTFWAFGFVPISSLKWNQYCWRADALHNLNFATYRNSQSRKSRTKEEWIARKNIRYRTPPLKRVDYSLKPGKMTTTSLQFLYIFWRHFNVKCEWKYPKHSLGLYLTGLDRAHCHY